ncbi:MAG: hypothetical protein JOZ86_05905 [Candidatus Eremiobacteraeota bacterium]|nr:hypothetical protein [Candidatus Eremiobacteraeota bacterium]
MARKPSDARVNIISTISATASSPVRAGSSGTRNDRRPSAIVPVQTAVTTVGVDAFIDNIGETTTALRRVFETQFTEAFGEYKLDEIEVDLEISADGKVGFLGSSVGVKGSSSFKLKFKRQK